MENILHVRNLVVDFSVHGRRQKLRAIDGVSFSIASGEILGLVGESGCGKSTTGNAIVGLAPIASGTISFNGRQINMRTARETRQFRRDVQMIFQDPMGALNPRLTIGDAIMETLYVHRKHLNIKNKKSRIARTYELLDMVGIDAQMFSRYPHELSGGQRQRVGIARAIAVRPKLLIADEPVSALDVSIQVQILNLIKDLSRQLGFACIFIAHDLAVVRYMCDRTMVMYLGKIVEEGPGSSIFESPRHPYTEALISAVPDVQMGLTNRGRNGSRIILEGEVPSRFKPLQTCGFASRCRNAHEICRTTPPPTRDFSNGHTALCHLPLTHSENTIQNQQS